MLEVNLFSIPAMSRFFPAPFPYRCMGEFLVISLDFAFFSLVFFPEVASATFVSL